MDVYYDAKRMLKHELHEIIEKGEISGSNLEAIHMILDSIKDACKIIMYEEYSEDGYSYADGDRDMSEYSYARGRGRNAKRDAMGRYSSRGGYSMAGDEMIDELRDLMQDAPDEQTRMEFQRFIQRIEQMQ